MQIIKSLIRRLEKQFPDKYINIEQAWDYHKAWPEAGIGREIVSKWGLYVEGVTSHDYDNFEHLVDAVNRLTNTKTRILIVRHGADGKVDPFKGHEPSPKNGNFRGD